MTKKFIKKLLLFAVIFCLLFIQFTKLFIITNTTLQGTLNSFYALEDNSLDILFIGSCHMYSTVMPMLLYDEQKLTGHLAATPGQDIPTSYFFMKEALKTQQPELIFVDVYAINRESTYLSEQIFTEDTYASFGALAPSREKIEYILEYPYDVKRLEMFVPFLKFHNRWTSLTPSDFQSFPDEILLEKGWFPYWNVLTEMPSDDLFDSFRFTHAYQYEEYDRGFFYNDVTDVSNLDEITLEYLDKIVELADSKNISLCFLISPYSMEPEEAEKFNALKQYARQLNIPVLDFNDNDIIEQLQLTYSDMTDYEHVNAYGAMKITDYISDFIKENYHFDHTQNDTVYKQWDQDLIEWRKKYY